MERGTLRRIEFAEGLTDLRRSARTPVRIVAQLKEMGMSRTAIEVIDISIQGCRAFCSASLLPGYHIVLTLPTFAPFGATVIWVRDGQIGLEFNRPLHPSIVSHIAGNTVGPSRH